MNQPPTLSLQDVILRTLVTRPEDVAPLIKYLGMTEAPTPSSRPQVLARAAAIASHLCEMGSNSFATVVRGHGIPYDEVVLDVAGKLGVKEARPNNTVEANEALILQKLFADALGKMSDDEKRALFSSMGLSEKDIPVGAAGVLIVQLLLKNFGGFAVYRISVIVANLVSRALLGSGLSFAAGAALTRSISIILGPVGWIASGLWLANDIAGPAFRKTVPAVIHVAMLRQMLTNRVTIGVVGDGSTGKDALIKAVFGVDTGNIHPVAGSTRDAAIYELDDSGSVQLMNFPGFNDIRNDVNERVHDLLRHPDVFILVIDISRGVSDHDVAALKRVQSFDRPVLVCLNKCDLPRRKDLADLLHSAHDRLGDVRQIQTAFDPDDRLTDGTPVNCRAVHEWVVEEVTRAGKETAHIPKSEYV